MSLPSLIYILILVYQTFKQDIAHKYLGSNISIRYGRKKFESLMNLPAADFIRLIQVCFRMFCHLKSNSAS